MNNKISLNIMHYKENKPRQFWAIIATFITFISLIFIVLGYMEKHTPKLVISDIAFYYAPIPNGNITGVLITIENQSDAWAKNVMVEFINDNGYSKYEKLKYYKENNKIMLPRDIKPNGKILDGYLPQGAGGSPTIYQNGEKQYKVDIIINWENDRGKKYSLVAKYESMPDGFTKAISFEKKYSYDSFTNLNKVKQIKKEFENLLPDDMTVS